MRPTLLSEQYRVQAEPFWDMAEMMGDDGYDRIERAGRYGWEAIPSWGLDGWDLGGWPLVVISHRRTPDGWELVECVEGDATMYRYPTEMLRDLATDELAVFHWRRHEREEWVEGVQDG